MKSFSIKNICTAMLSNKIGGEGEIRTPDRLAPMPHFECGAFNHSATSPQGRAAEAARVVGGANSMGLQTRQETPSRPGLINRALRSSLR